ncbi:PEX19-like protein [Mya arenaria]|uniref:Peroxin-19 n=1 Tax=Mya arenaria TaxID=6604 RepID=A0ABY7E9C1_MYAAR|nr:PEX19-like protein [Mya arenaria]
MPSDYACLQSSYMESNRDVNLKGDSPFECLLTTSAYMESNRDVKLKGGSPFECLLTTSAYMESNRDVKLKGDSPFECLLTTSAYMESNRDVKLKGDSPFECLLTSSAYMESNRDVNLKGGSPFECLLTTSAYMESNRDVKLKGDSPFECLLTTSAYMNSNRDVKLKGDSPFECLLTTSAYMNSNRDDHYPYVHLYKYKHFRKCLNSSINIIQSEHASLSSSDTTHDSKQPGFQIPSVRLYEARLFSMHPYSTHHRHIESRGGIERRSPCSDASSLLPYGLRNSYSPALMNSNSSVWFLSGLRNGGNPQSRMFGPIANYCYHFGFQRNLSFTPMGQVAVSTCGPKRTRKSPVMGGGLDATFTLQVPPRLKCIPIHAGSGIETLPRFELCLPIFDGFIALKASAHVRAPILEILYIHNTMSATWSKDLSYPVRQAEIRWQFTRKIIQQVVEIKVSVRSYVQLFPLKVTIPINEEPHFPRAPQITVSIVNDISMGLRYCVKPSWDIAINVNLFVPIIEFYDDSLDILVYEGFTLSDIDKGAAAGGGDDPISDMFAEQFSDEMAREFEDAMKGLLSDDPNMMQQIEKLAEAAGNTGTGVEDDMMKMFSGLGLDPNAQEDNFMPMMQNMMKTLLSKDVLYPSLKEISEKILVEFDKEKSTDTDDMKKQRFEQIMEMMQKMQDLGQPPKEIVGDMAPGLDFDANGVPKFPGTSDACSIINQY